jgi:hypothetical protein
MSRVGSTALRRSLPLSLSKGKDPHTRSSRCRRRFPPAKYTQKPAIHHKLSMYFVLKKAQFPPVTTQNSSTKAKRDPLKA